MDLGLRGRTAVVTGASAGIGAEIARVLAAEGCDLHLAARGKEALDEIAGQLRAEHGVEVHTHPVDLRSGADLERLAELVGTPDILINNAGDMPGGSLTAVDEEAWREGWELKVFGYINLIRKLYARMKQAGRGVVVNVIGAAGERPDADYIAGITGNAALMAFTRALGSKSWRDGIRVVGINPGPVATARITRLIDTNARFAAMAADFPFGRPAHPREIADMAAFLASDRSGYTTGTIVTIDGGLSLI
ncbi:short-chain dehydrogenase/reductase [Nocardia seriolae]|uniref:Short-chain dehydrogenase n=1 Tax=Nocardia seriolae TaxID=37332 RepID=A0ABC9YPR7_9NOCA|nr:short-chain dehydrogenase/reductase [Nocardia seriolae]BEK97913.1 SDR family oxidoreductase [Nocardia seriolae]GAM45404.1 short-chain dehydrogenase [Nocardia seriolae]GAP27427.1 short-chain dehydrogenase [Nocardia seriolae]GEM23114.1 short-chain dehydrogenase [Nocardia seriolae NBRC 15557]